MMTDWFCGARRAGDDVRHSHLASKNFLRLFLSRVSPVIGVTGNWAGWLERWNSQAERAKQARVNIGDTSAC